MNLFCYIIFLFGVIGFSKQDCLENGENSIPFIASIFTDNGECQGILISQNYILTNGKCINGSKSVVVRLGFKNYPFNVAGQNFVSEEVILHPNFRKVMAGHYLNDVALIKLSSSVKLTQTIKPATFLLDEPNLKNTLGQKASLVVWKAGYLNFISGVIQETSKCLATFGDDFDTNQHFCIEIIDDIFIIHVYENVGHPVIVNNNIVGFAIHYPVLNKNGKIYRIKKVFPIIKWIEQYTTLNTENEMSNNNSQVLGNCRLQNRVINVPQLTSVKIEEELLSRFKNFVDIMISEKVQDIRNETQDQLSLLQQMIQNKGEVIAQLETEANKKFLSIEDLLSTKSKEIMLYINEKLSFIQNDVKDKGDHIMSEIESKYSAFQNTLGQREEKLISNFGSEISKLQNLIKQKDTQLATLAKRLSDLENAIKTLKRS